MFFSSRYHVGHAVACTSQASGTAGGPTHLELWNLRAKLRKVYEDIKDDPNDVATLPNISERKSK